jgi:hypothetical protein
MRCWHAWTSNWWKALSAHLTPQRAVMANRQIPCAARVVGPSW